MGVLKNFLNRRFHYLSSGQFFKICSKLIHCLSDKMQQKLFPHVSGTAVQHSTLVAIFEWPGMCTLSRRKGDGNVCLQSVNYLQKKMCKRMLKQALFHLMELGLSQCHPPKLRRLGLFFLSLDAVMLPLSLAFDISMGWEDAGAVSLGMRQEW